MLSRGIANIHTCYIYTGVLAEETKIRWFVVRWVVPTTAAANVLCRQINAHLRNAHIRLHARIHAYTTLATIDSNQRYLCYTVSTPYSSFSPASSPAALRRAAPPVAAALASPLPRAVIQSSTSYDLYVVIPSVWSSGRLGFSLRAPPFVSIRPARTRAYR